jgi:hypothetical protein
MCALSDASICSLSCYIDKGHLYTWGLCGNTRRLGHEELEDHYEPKRVAIKEWKGLNGEVADVTLGEIGGLARIEYE